ncbi:MAG: ABC transporter ATP-binding protein [Thermoplasmata archaeon]
MEQILLTADGLTKNYGKITALDNASFSLFSGLSMLLGPNGSGKTTFLRIASGLTLPDKGKVKIFGCDPHREYARIKDRVSFALQKPHVPKVMKVRDFLEAITVEKSASTYMKAVKALEIEDILDKKFKELSGGFKKRVSLAQAFIGNPDLIIVDEPFANLDVEAKLHISHLMNQLVKKDKISLLIITHNLGALEPDHLTMLYAGKVVISEKYDNLPINDIKSFVIQKNGEKKEVNDHDTLKEYIENDWTLIDVKKINFEEYLKEKFDDEKKYGIK